MGNRSKRVIAVTSAALLALTVVATPVAAEDPDYLACSVETRSEIVVPIRVRGRYRAQIDVDSHHPAA